MMNERKVYKNTSFWKEDLTPLFLIIWFSIFCLKSDGIDISLRKFKGSKGLNLPALLHHIYVYALDLYISEQTNVWTFLSSKVVRLFSSN